ncbi:MAG: hypothetical protein ACK5LS_02410 [Propioniciclava sp.]
MSSNPSGTGPASSPAGDSSPGAGKVGGLPPRVWIGLAIAVFSILFIAVNWKETDISFLFFHAQMPLTIALALTFIGGGVTGALLMRRRITG